MLRLLEWFGRRTRDEPATCYHREVKCLVARNMCRQTGPKTESKRAWIVSFAVAGMFVRGPVPIESAVRAGGHFASGWPSRGRRFESFCAAIERWVILRLGLMTVDQRSRSPHLCSDSFLTRAADGMARAEYIKALISSHSEGDDERFYAIALQVAAQAARQGHNVFAEDLRALVEQAREQVVSKGQRARPVPIVKPRGELAGLLSASFPKLRLAHMALEPGSHQRLEQVLLEYRQRAKLREHGLHPLRKLLLTGPPGTGKTMTAAVLAGELGLPLFTIQFDGLITKYLGETAAKLRLIFDAVRDTVAVYLFDEFDAIGSDRTTPNELGEIRRVLNSFLQFLEQDDSESLVVAATNNPQLLDRALFRRFDAVIEYHLPSPEVAGQVFRSSLALLDTSDVKWTALLDRARGFSHADIVRACEQAAKNVILDGRTRVSTEDLEATVSARIGSSEGPPPRAP